MEEISIKAQPIFQLGHFMVTNGLLSTVVVSLVIIWVAILLHRRITLIPGRVQSVVEMGMEWLLDLMESMLGSVKEAEQYLPLIATIFLFILLCNLSGILPGVGSFTIYNGSATVPLFRSPAADLNFTLSFAVISVIVTNLIGMASVGVFAHLGKFFNFRNPVKFFIGILEIISEFAKIISLSFRLFGNIFAGEVLLIVIFSLFRLFIPLPFIFLEIFVGLIQSLVFAVLTLVSIAIHTGIHDH